MSSQTPVKTEQPKCDEVMVGSPASVTETQKKRIKSITKKRTREDEMEGETKKPEDGAEAPKKKSRKSRDTLMKKSQSPVELLGLEAVSLFFMKKKINEWHSTHNKFVIPKDLRKPLRSIVGHSSTIEDADVVEAITQLYKQGLTLEATQYMARTLIYYEVQHNFELKKRDQALLERAIHKPVPAIFDKVKAAYESYLFGFEEKRGQYAKYLRTGAEPKSLPKREQNKSSKKPKPKHLAYNLFIAEQWKLRKPEFNKLSQEKNIAEVMKLLSKEWKAEPELKQTYQAKCDELNKINQETEEVPQQPQQPPQQLQQPVEPAM